MIIEIDTNKDNNSGTNETKSTLHEFRSYNILGKSALYKGDLISAYENFKKVHSIIGCAYCKLLNQEEDRALSMILPVKGSSSAINWLISLIKLLKDDLSYPPTYMQIRNFYEQDLNLFFIYTLEDYINKLLMRSQFYEYYNREIYKYNARVLLNYDFTALAEEYIVHSRDIYYNDPETHYILGDIYMRKGQRKEARKEFEISNKVSSEYLPAKEKIRELDNSK